MSLIPAINLFPPVVDTGEKSPKSLKYFCRCQRRTDEKLFTGVNDTADKFFAGVNNTGDKTVLTIPACLLADFARPKQQEDAPPDFC